MDHTTYCRCGGCIKARFDTPDDRFALTSTYCVMCASGEPHMCDNQPKEGKPAVIEGTGIITRIDSHTLSVDGKHIAANEDQEDRIRALTFDQRHRLLKILGK